MALVKTFRQTRVFGSGSRVNASCLDVSVPLPPNDHRGILPNRDQDTSITWNGDTTIGLEESDDAEDAYYANCVATAGGSFTRSKTQADEPHTIVWRVLRQGTVLELDPVDFNLKSHHELRKIRILTPARFLSNCITICENKNTGYLVIDFITKTSFLYSLTFSFSEFITDNRNSLSDSGHSLTEANASNWRSIRYPFTFDFKRPQILHAVSHKELVASTTDGTIIHMHRDTALSHITATPFQGLKAPQGFGRFFGWGSEDRVLGNSSLSHNAVVAMVAVPHARLLVTISISRALRVWSLDSKHLLEEKELISPVDDRREDKIILGSQPAKLLEVPEWSTARGDGKDSTYLCTYLPLGDGLFKIWELKFTGPKYLLDLGEKHEVVPQIPDTYSTWIVNDFHLMDASKQGKDKFMLSIMWKSNTSLALYQTSFPLELGKESVWYSSCEDDQADLDYLQISNQEQNTEFYLQKVFGPYGYTGEIIEAALLIYGVHYALKPFDSLNENTQLQTLAGKVAQTVGASVSMGYKADGVTPDHTRYNSDLANEWARFDRLCAELERQGKEVLSLEWDSALEMFWVVKASFTHIVRPAVPIELAFHNKASSPSSYVSELVGHSVNGSPSEGKRVLKVLDAMHSFTRNLSPTQFGETIASIADDYSSKKFSTSERIQEIRSTFLKAHVTNDAFDSLNQTLSSIGSIDKTLDLLRSTIFKSVKNTESQSKSVLTFTGCVTLSNALFEALTTLRLTVCDILVALVATCEVENIVAGHAKQYTRFTGLLHAIDTLFAFMSVQKSHLSSETSATLENLSLNSSLSSPNLSFFQYLSLAHQNKFSNSVCRKAMAQSLNELWNFWNISDASIVGSRFCASLLAAGETAKAEEVGVYLSTDAFSIFIRAQIYLQSQEGFKALHYFQIASTELSERPLTSEELDIVKSLKLPAYNSNSFGKGKAIYYLSVSKAVLSANLLVTSLAAARVAQQSLGFSSKSKETLTEEKLALARQIYDHLFELGIQTSSYDDSYGALEELAFIFQQEKLPAPSTEDSVVFEEPKIVSYVESLAGNMVQTGNTAQLCQYKFGGLSNIVCDLFLKKAKTTLVRATQNEITSTTDDGFLYYKALYSWNINHRDYKGGKFFSFFFLLFLFF